LGWSTGFSWSSFVRGIVAPKLKTLGQIRSYIVEIGGAERGAQIIRPNKEPVVVNDVFEIKPQYNTGQDAGVVAVLNRLMAASPEALVGLVAFVRTPDGKTYCDKVDDARDHGTAKSLFFRSLTTLDMPLGSRIELHDDSR
jgi:hypothetical protein